MPLKPATSPARGLLVDHHGVDQAVEIDVLDVERLAHGVAAGAEHGQTSALSVTGSNCVLTASGLVMTRLRARAVANTLTRIASMISTKLWAASPITIIQKGELTVGICEPAKNIFDAAAR
jgi:hypothetical protein